MLRKIRQFKLRRAYKIAATLPTGTGHLDANTGKVVWPKSA